jgi:general secretion pathway protein K
MTTSEAERDPIPTWRTHSCVPRRHSCRRPVSHARAGVEKSLDTARTSACATSARRGSALLTVLWLSAALAAIGFSLATTIHGETERTSTALDGLRSYYLAAAGIDRAAVEILWGIQDPASRTIPEGATQMTYHFASGDVRVEFIPETAKLNVNKASLEDLTRLGMALDELRADGLAHSIDQARTPAGASPDPTPGPSFQPPGASLQEIEELLSVPGVTPELFYGAYGPLPDAAGGRHLVRRAGLVDCLSVYGRGSQVDVNAASPAVLAAVGMNPAAIAAIVARRNAGPIPQEQLGDIMAMAGDAGGRLRVGGRSILTIRATARLRLDGGQLSSLRRTVAAMVKYMPAGYDSPIHILRWYDTAWSE